MRFIKKIQRLLNENTIIKIRLAIVKNTSHFLKSNTKNLNEQLINIECCHYKLEQYSRWQCTEIQVIPQNLKIKTLEDMVIKIIQQVYHIMKKYV